MRVKRPYIVLSFQATVDAMAWEKYCAQAGIPGRLPEDWQAWESRLQKETTLHYDAVATVQQ